MLLKKIKVRTLSDRVSEREMLQKDQEIKLMAVEKVLSGICHSKIFFSFFRIVSSDKSTIVAQVQEQGVGAGTDTPPGKKMGRKKIQISRIVDERNRQVGVIELGEGRSLASLKL
jgi:hypothetical protein